jgi:hypothetical protein
MSYQAVVCRRCKKTASSHDSLRYLCKCPARRMKWEGVTLDEPPDDLKIFEQLRQEDEEARREAAAEEAEKQNQSPECEQRGPQGHPPEDPNEKWTVHCSSDAELADNFEKYLWDGDADSAKTTKRQKERFTRAFRKRLEKPGQYHLQKFVAEQGLSMKQAKPLIIQILRSNRFWMTTTLTENRGATR